MGEIPEGLSGSKDMACMERRNRNLGDPARCDIEISVSLTRSVRRAEDDRESD